MIKLIPVTTGRRFGLNTMLIAALIFITSIPLASLRNISYDVIGGNHAHIEDFSFSVSLFVKYYEDQNTGEGCGASIINQRILLTAANCVRMTPDKVEAYTGSPYMFDGTLSNIARIVPHQSFDERRFHNDLALMWVMRPLQLGPWVGRVALMRRWERRPVQIAGFGVTNIEGVRSFLRFTEQRILAEESCLKRINKMPRETFCAVWPSGYPGYDDGGSALVQERFIQVGLLSYMSLPDDVVAVYTNVTFYYDWIKYTARAVSCSGKQPKNTEENCNYCSWETVEEDEHGWNDV